VVVGYAKSDLIDVQEFTRQADGEEIVIGLPVAGTFLALPAEAIEILDSLASGKTVGKAQAEFARVHGVEPDIDDLLRCLEQRGFVRLHGREHRSEIRPQGAVGSTGKGVRYHFASIPQSVAKQFFGPFPISFYLVTIIVALGVACSHPSLIPRGDSLVFSNHRTVQILILSLFVYFTIFLHELAHLLAAKAQGVNSRLGISRRLWVLVAETDMTGLWAVPSRQRYLPMLAGPLLDGFSAALLFLLLFAQSKRVFAMAPPVEQFCRALIFAYLLRLLWQCCLFVRTDFYYVIANFFHCKSLMRDTEVFVKNLFLRVIGSTALADQAHIPSRERRIIRFYSVLWALGRGLAFFSLFFITLPILFKYLTSTLLILRRGYDGNHYQYIDSVMVGLLNLMPLVIGLSLWVTSIVRKRRTP
jgi:putative peptide zinc metalloprotease protein